MDLLEWFKSHSGTISANVAIHDFSLSEGGRGMIATRDLDEGDELFNIPRALLLSPRTSELPKLYGEREWRRFRLHKGWNGLILCMMWEEAAGQASKWAGYFGTDIFPCALVRCAHVHPENMTSECKRMACVLVLT